MIVFDPSRKIIAPDESKDFTCSQSSTPVVIPEATGSSLIQLPGCAITPYTPSYTADDNVFTFSGFTEGAKIVSDPPSGWIKVNDTQMRRVSSSASQGINVLVGNKYNKRFVTNVYGSNSFSSTVAKNAGFHDQTSLGGMSILLLNNLTKSVTPGVSSQCIFMDGGSYINTDPGPVLSYNTSSMFRSMDWSGISISRTGHSIPRYPGILVSPRHAIFAKHVGVSVSDVVWFKRMDGTVQKVTVAAIASHPTLDLQIAGFNQDVTGCAIYKTLPSNWKEYLPAMTESTKNSYGFNGAIPIVMRTFNTGYDLPGSNYLNSTSPKIRIVWSSMVDFYNSGLGGKYTTYKGISSESLNKFYHEIYDGDSSSPSFLFVPNSIDIGVTNFTPALMTVTYTTTDGASIPDNQDWINTNMDAISVTIGDARMLKLGTIDISKFQRYFV